jgi:hypothetical protein
MCVGWRYIFDLKSCGLIALQGRGPEAQVQLTAPAILALADTIRQRVTTSRVVTIPSRPTPVAADTGIGRRHARA